MYNPYPWNGNNSYYNAVPQYVPQQAQQTITPIASQNYIRPTLQGKSVDSIDVVKAIDIPLDGTISYFPLTDGSLIITKQLLPDGTSKTVTYKAIEQEKPKTVKYITSDELVEELNKIDLNGFSNDIEGLKKQIKELKEEMNKKKKGE